MPDEPLRFDPDNDSLADATEWMNDYCAQGKICPCCDKLDKEYQNRTITKTMGELLVLIVAKSENAPDADGGWVEVPPLAAELNSRGTGGGDLAKLRYEPWGLLEQMIGFRPDGSPRLGWYRPTPEACKFVRGLSTVVKYCHVRRGECTGSHGPQITINDVMGENFNYDRLMGPPRDD